MLSFNPDERPTAEEVLAHPWMTGEMYSEEDVL